MGDSQASRRHFIAVCTTLGVGSTSFVGALHAMAQEHPGTEVTADMINRAAALSGITISPADTEMMKSQLSIQRAAVESIRVTNQGVDDWPNTFRAARLYPAVEYIQANRARTLAMQKMAEIFEKIDVLVTLNSGSQLTVTNLTGHPAVIAPDGLRGPDAPQAATIDNDTDDNIGGPGTPTSLTFVGQLYHDSDLLALARGFQQTTGFHQNHPPDFHAPS